MERVETVEAEQKQAEAINTDNGHHPDHNLLIRVESDVRHLQSDIVRLEADMKTGFAKIDADMKRLEGKVDADIKGIRKGIVAILITPISRFASAFVGLIINYFIGR